MASKDHDYIFPMQTRMKQRKMDKKQNSADRGSAQKKNAERRSSSLCVL
jgi:hypothetical protein